MTAFRFISPCSPVLAKAVPTGPDWIHEVKFDGYRVQAHKVGTDVVIFSRNGHDFTSRFATIAYILRDLPAKSAVLDGELVASDQSGAPDFCRLHRRFVNPDEVHLWCFDLLALNGRDLRPDPLTKRQARLRGLLERFDCPPVLPSESFDDGLALLRVAEKRRLEGVVSKRRDAPIGRATAGIGERSRRRRGARRTGSGGGCSRADLPSGLRTELLSMGGAQFPGSAEVAHMS